MKVLLIGQSVRHIARSAALAGHEVVAAECYCDLDLFDYVREAIELSLPVGGGSLRLSAEAISSLVDRIRPEAVVLGPGLEGIDLPAGQFVANNPPRLAAQVSDKLWLARWLDRQGFPAIPTSLAGSSMEPPFVEKPRRGAGGVGGRIVSDQAALPPAGSEMIVQPYIKGISASVSLISDGSRAVAIAANEQLVGEGWLGAEGFLYCGNITPLDPSLGDAREMIGIAEEVVGRLGLIGSNGVDFILTGEGPVVVEVNPRFQGSLDAVELATGMNVFEAHLAAFSGRLPRPAPPRRTAGRALTYASGDHAIDRDLRLDVEGLVDVPRPGSRIAKGGYLASILAIAGGRDATLKLLKMRKGQLDKALGYQETAR
ncbi:MAG: ATP-grasp domain-containing protein [Methanotrichaceae archaeon]|nr:ATP-grasp domain-containing protein [Methanotrichaceae archaeon]